jgi:hypothetical protein
MSLQKPNTIVQQPALHHRHDPYLHQCLPFVVSASFLFGMVNGGRFEKFIVRRRVLSILSTILSTILCVGDFAVQYVGDV